MARQRPDYFRQYTRLLREDGIQALGGKCECCGEHRYEFLAFDHPQGGGGQHRKKRHARSWHRDLQKAGWPRAEVRLLCHNCNLSRGFYGFCPHSKEGLS